MRAPPKSVTPFSFCLHPRRRRLLHADHPRSQRLPLSAGYDRLLPSAKRAAVASDRTPDAPPEAVTFDQAFVYWLKLGFVSFGGPAGQIALMHQELVERRRWISEPNIRSREPSGTGGSPRTGIG